MSEHKVLEWNISKQTEETFKKWEFQIIMWINFSLPKLSFVINMISKYLDPQHFCF